MHRFSPHPQQQPVGVDLEDTRSVGVGGGGVSGSGRVRSSFGTVMGSGSTEYYGSAITSSSTGNFPIPGSTLGPYFSIGQLGKGTFASIHQCINLAYHHNYTHDDTRHVEQTNPTLARPSNVTSSSSSPSLPPPLPLPSLPQCAINNPRRLVAAKVDNGGFNVLSGESAILEYLSETMPTGMVPMYQGHLATPPRVGASAADVNSAADNGTATTTANTTTTPTVTNLNTKDPTSMIPNNKNTSDNTKSINALFMEYIPGRDLGQIREWWTRKQQQQQQQQQRSEETTTTTTTTDDRPNNKRRVAIEDAVQLCTYILQLLQNMHEVGIVHRDVKASNVVKLNGRSATNLQFAVVDFGLSRQITATSTMSDKEKDVRHIWTGRDFMKPNKSHIAIGGSSSTPHSSRSNFKAYYRRERPTAEFRGTSMYASPRVHQLRDYCARDDMWSLMYVFCELVSGGLPWMEFALNRRRDDCQRLKERIHGLEPTTRTSSNNNGEGGDGNSIGNHTTQSFPSNPSSSMLLMGGDYYIALYKRNRGQIDVTDGTDVDESVILPEPLAMSKDLKKTMALDAVFDHLKTLKFTDVPDYETIRISMEAFLDDQHETVTAKHERMQVSRINWDQVASNYISNNQGGVGCIDESNRPTKQPLWGITSIDTGMDVGRSKVPTWELEKSTDSSSKTKDQTLSTASRDDDPVDWMLLADAEEKIRDDKSIYQSLDGEDADLARLPLEMRFRIAQMEFHARHYKTVAPHIALRDWLRVALPLLYGEWDSTKFEKGGHRTNDDGYRREFFVRLIDKCLDCAKPFKGFCNMLCYYETIREQPNSDGDDTGPPKKRRRYSRRRIVTTNVRLPPSIGLPTEGTDGTDLVLVSKAMFGLKMAKRAEEMLSRAPPPRLSFGSF